MSDTRTGQSQGATGAGWVFFAGIILIMVGIFHAIDGLVAIFKDNFYLVGKNGLVVSVSYTTWGWVLLILGIIVLLAGFGVMVGAMWARVVGIILAGLSMIVSIGFIAAFPLWSLIVIGLDVIIIYALAVHAGELKQ